MTTINTENLTIRDPMIHLADSQTIGDQFDIGFIGHYSDSANGPKKHTGFVRDADNSQYYLFNGLEQEGLDSSRPDNFIQVGGTNWALADINAANVVASGVTSTSLTSTGTLTGADVTAAHMDSVDYIGFTSSGTVNLPVTVASKTDQHRYTSTGSGLAYYIDGKESPFLLLSPGNTYRFTLSSSDMSSHPFRFYLDAAKLTAYTTNVTSTATYTEITITDATPPVLHYQCSAHGYMGNAVNTQARGQLIDSAVITSLMPKTGTDFADSAWIVSQIPVTGTDFADSSWILSQIPQVGVDYVDSAYVTSYVTSVLPKTGVDFADSSWIVANFLDSALTTQLIDSAYIQDRQAGGGGGTVDSAYVESVSLDSERTQLLINAAYIQARQSLLDSSLTSQLIDSAYVQLRQSSAGGLDSSLTTQLIDSAYVSARAGAGTDSAAVIQLIDSAYVQARGEGAAPFELTNFRYNADSGQTSFTGVDVNGRTLAVDSGKLQVFLNGILLADSDFSHNASKVDLLVAADSADILTVVKMDGNNTISNFQSKHFIYNADSGQTVFTGADRSGQVLTYSSTDRTNVYLNGILLTNDSDFTATDGSTVTLTVGADSADVLDINVFRGSNISSMDSASVQLIVDSAYVQLHAKGLDYGVLTNTPLSGVDSAEVIKLITANAIDSGVALQLLLDSIETINLIDSSHVQLHAVGLDYNRLSNLPSIPVTGTDFADSSWIISQIPVTGTDFADSSWILSQIPKTGVDFADSAWIVANFLDSALTTQLIDSSYIQLRQSSVGTGGLDSALTTQLIDSAYVQLRQSAGGGSGTVDSAYVEANSLDSERTKLLIDSDYILARVTNTQPGEYNNDRTEFTVGGADSGRLVFDTQKALNLVAGNTEVYLNGILQLSGTDYTVDSSAVTFTSGVAANHQVTVLERAGKILTQRGLVENVFAYTTAAPTTSITGADDKGATLDVSEGYADVFLNGILLRDSDDYSINDAGTILTLVSATDSSDIVTVKNSKGVIVTPQVKRFEYTTATPATTISGSDLHSNTLAYSPGSLQVHVNGILLQEKTDFTATTGNSVLLTTATDSGDDVTVSAFSAPGSKLELYKFTADSGQTVFSGNDAAGRFMSYEPGNIQVFLNGLLLNDSDDYTASNTKAVRLLTAAALNDELKVASFETTSEITRSNTWTAPTGTVSAAAGDKLFIDTSGGARTVTLPSSATMGDEIRIIDATGNAASNNITVSRNGHNIHGASSDLVINIARAGIGLAYYNVAQGWLLIEN